MLLLLQQSNQRALSHNGINSNCSLIGEAAIAAVAVAVVTAVAAVAAASTVLLLSPLLLLLLLLQLLFECRKLLLK